MKRMPSIGSAGGRMSSPATWSTSGSAWQPPRQRGADVASCAGDQDAVAKARQGAMRRRAAARSTPASWRSPAGRPAARGRPPGWRAGARSTASRTLRPRAVSPFSCTLHQLVHRSRQVVHGTRALPRVSTVACNRPLHGLAQRIGDLGPVGASAGRSHGAGRDRGDPSEARGRRWRSGSCCPATRTGPSPWPRRSSTIRGCSTTRAGCGATRAASRDGELLTVQLTGVQSHRARRRRPGADPGLGPPHTRRGSGPVGSWTTGSQLGALFSSRVMVLRC